jgi:hypothetical protein
MQAQNKNCQNCKQDFTIEPDDFSFYEKIKVPPPTFCPECRYIRRLLDRNEYNFYRRKCDATGDSIISIYRPDAPFPVYKQDYWKSDAWDATSYGRDFDFNRPFFEQYEELRRVVPHVAMVNSNSVNSEYSNQSQNNKDCYMFFTSDLCEKCAYGSWNQTSFLCSDSYMIGKSELCYECMNITKCSNCAWAYDCADCVSVYFSKDCRSCTDCFGCVGLRSKQYHWFNENIGKDEYKKRMNNFHWDRASIREVKDKFAEFQIKFPVKHYHGSQAKDSSGDYIENSENAHSAFNCRGNKDTAYMQDAWQNTEDCRDCTEIIVGQLAYEIQGVDSPSNTIVARSCFNTISDSCYCDMCFGANNCFGCFGLKKGQYCILNKQYTKDEYLKLKEKIIEHMRKTGEWGEYFPGNVSPFAYNESMAQDYFPLTKEEALSRGYSWYDKPESKYNITISSKYLPKTIEETTDNILDHVIHCKTHEDGISSNHCTTAFKITSLELTIYKKMGISIPEYCFPCRRTERFKLRNPRKLWARSCMCSKTHTNHEGQCQEQFETSYSPDRPEIVYCEKCYQQEVV